MRVEKQFDKKGFFLLPGDQLVITNIDRHPMKYLGIIVEYDEKIVKTPMDPVFEIYERRMYELIEENKILKQEKWFYKHELDKMIKGEENG